MNSANVNAICDRIASAIRDDDEFPDVFNAFIAVLTFHISLLECPHCRRQATRALKQAAPDMLHRANAAAAERHPGVPANTCH
jgi:hypothetical protein